MWALGGWVGASVLAGTALAEVSALSFRFFIEECLH